MASQQEIIQTFMRSLDNSGLSGVEAVDEAIRVCSNYRVNTLQDAVNIMASECNEAGSADNFLRNYCGIILDNEDTGSLTGSDAYGWETKTNESIIPENGDFQAFTGDSFSANGLNFKLSYINYYDYAYDRNFYSLSYTEGLIWQALYSWWGRESLDLIETSYGNNFGFNESSATVHDINVGFYNSNDGILAYTQSWYDVQSGLTMELDLQVNMYYYDNLDTSNPNGSTYTAGAGYLDRTIAHELTHAAMAANITNFNSLPLFIKEGMAELTHGIDDQRYSDIQYLAGNPYALYSALDVNQISSGSSINYAGGYMFLRYLAKRLYDIDNMPTYDSNVSQNISADISDLWFDDINLNTNSEIFGQSLDSISTGSEKSSVFISKDENIFTKSADNTQTKIIAYANESNAVFGIA